MASPQPGCLRTKLPLHKYLLYGWIENLDTVRHIPIGNVWGVRIAVTPYILLVAGVIYLLLPYVHRGLPFDVLVSLAATNLFFGLGSFLPLPSIDGWLIWREILRSLRSQFRPHPSNQ